uniref:Dedicator of cytokinesis protein 2 n=1 Tax=Aceria tosichella TaxID=561515 RepID=A0A6G1S8A4_9ACAR
MSQASDEDQPNNQADPGYIMLDYSEPVVEPFIHAVSVNHKSLSPQQVTVAKRPLLDSERIIVDEIDKCFINWYEPWKQSYLDGGPKFGAVYDLMEGLIHYEEQIISSQTELPSERLTAIAKAVARLIDYGNAILDIDITIRANDETFRELDPISMTTIELYKAHIKAYKLRQKLLDNYFKKNKQDNSDGTNNLTASNSPSSATLRVSHSASLNFLPSPTMDRSQRFSIGSTTSINTLGPASGQSSDGRRTPQPLSPSYIEVRTMSSSEDLTESQLEMKHTIATIRSKAFSDVKSSSTRCTLLLGVLAKVDSLLTMPATAEKLSNCFDLLDNLLDTIERLPAEWRTEEVRLIARSVLRILVRKVFIDDRDNHVEFQHSHWTTYLLSIIRMMSAADYEAYLKTFSNPPDLSTFLRDYLFIIKRLFSSRKNDDSMIGISSDSPSEPVYPDCWIEMSLLVCSTFLKSLMYLYQILRQYFGSNTQIWCSYLDCLVHFILQDVLHRDRPMLKERQKLVADDMRKTAAEYVWITWDSLNSDQRYEMFDDIIEPLLKACALLSSQQRSILLPIFYDMMQCDYDCQYISSRGTICNSGSVSSGRSTMDQNDTRHSFLSYGDRFESAGEYQLPNGNSDGIYLAPPTIHNDTENSEESLPYLSFRDHQSTSGFQSSSDDGTVLTKFTHLIIGKLYSLMIDQDLGDDEFKIELCSAIAGESNGKYQYHRVNQKSLLVANAADVSQFKSMARHTAELIDEFIQICLDLRQANRLSYSHLRLLCLFKLILFFRDKVDRIELYLSNLHKLWRLHHSASRYVEAGFTLLEHAKSLPWTNKSLESHYRIMTRSFQSPVTDYTSLKLSLYTTIIEYFDQGQLWEAAVPLCRELIDIYQFKLYDYEKLSQILARLSSFFSNISNGQLRSQPEYFRVSFYGVGFPASLRDVTVIYRGRPFEKLSEFSATLLSKYPDARLLKTLNQPDDSLLLEPDAKYLQVNACTPMVDLKSKFKSISSSSSAAAATTTTSSSCQTDQGESTNVDINELQESILLYYKHNECDKFEFSRRINPPLRAAARSSSDHGDDFANMWRQRIILTTNSLPGMLPFFPVFLTETNTISPIKCAIEDLERANDRLASMVNRFKADKHQAEDVRPLGQLLLGIVDAAVNGGITKYEEAFFNNNTNNTTHIIKQAHINHHQHNNLQQQQEQQNNANKNPLTTETNSSDNQTRAPLPQQHSTQLPSAPLKTNDAAKLANRGAQSMTGSTVSIPSSANNNSHEQQPNNGERTTLSAQALDRRYSDHEHDLEQQAEPTFSQLEKLKCLIARQVPLLDEAIRLHRERVADIMRPQHDHLEASFKRLKNHVVSKYYRYLDKSDYNRSTNTARSFRSFARSPNRSIRSESRISLALSGASQSVATNTGSSGRFGRKRLSDVCGDQTTTSKLNHHQHHQRQDMGPNSTSATGQSSQVGDDKPESTSSIPYRQLVNERRSLPFLSGLQNLSLAEGHHQNQRLAAPQTVKESSFVHREEAAAAVAAVDEYQRQNFTLTHPPAPPLPSRRRVSIDRQLAASQVPPLPPTAFYQPEPDNQTSSDSTYVCIADMMQAIGVRKASNPYVRLSPDSEDGSTAVLDATTTKRIDVQEEDKNEATLVRL